jgi:hypothetical protein
MISNTEFWKIVVPGLIGALSALLLMIIRDLYIQGKKERRQERRSLLDRKLSELYVPLWIALGAGSNVLGNLLADDKAYERLMRNFHLLSPDLQGIATKYLQLGQGDSIRQRTLTFREIEVGVKLSKEFSRLLKDEIDVMTKDFQAL